MKEAEQRLADGTANGYLTADNNGRLAMTVSRETAVTAKDSTQNSGLDISLAALRSVIDLYNRTDAVTRQTIADNPQAALSRNFWNSVGQNVDMTHETTLTHFQPDEIARYYYALLAMSCMMAMGYSISTVAAAQANLSALGIRRTVAPLSRANSSSRASSPAGCARRSPCPSHWPISGSPATSRSADANRRRSLRSSSPRS